MNNEINYDNLDFNYAEAEKSLETKTKYDDLTPEEIAVLRNRFNNLGIKRDIVDKSDRLLILFCLEYHVMNKQFWDNLIFDLKNDK